MPCPCHWQAAQLRLAAVRTRAPAHTPSSEQRGRGRFADLAQGRLAGPAPALRSQKGRTHSGANGKDRADNPSLSADSWPHLRRPRPGTQEPGRRTQGSSFDRLWACATGRPCSKQPSLPSVLCLLTLKSGQQLLLPPPKAAPCLPNEGASSNPNPLSARASRSLPLPLPSPPAPSLASTLLRLDEAWHSPPCLTAAAPAAPGWLSSGPKRPGQL